MSSQFPTAMPGSGQHLEFFPASEPVADPIHPAHQSPEMASGIWQSGFPRVNPGPIDFPEDEASPRHLGWNLNLADRLPVYMDNQSGPPIVRFPPPTDGRLAPPTGLTPEPMTRESYGPHFVSNGPLFSFPNEGAHNGGLVKPAEQLGGNIIEQENMVGRENIIGRATNKHAYQSTMTGRPATGPVRQPLGALSANSLGQHDRFAPGVFHPMTTVSSTHSHNTGGPRPSGGLAVVPTRETISRIAAGFSPNYLGNIHIDRNRSAAIPDFDNCSLFLVGLPANVTTHQLLAQIRCTGRIYATHINPPEPDKNHHHSAAKIIFFESAAARRFYAHAHVHGLAVGGQRARVVHNRIRTAESADPRHASRVLVIYGPKAMVNPDALTVFFRSKLQFQIDEIVTLPTDHHDMQLVEYRFGSYRCQAQAAKMALTREFPEIIKVYYGVDPCA